MNLIRIKQQQEGRRKLNTVRMLLKKIGAAACGGLDSRCSGTRKIKKNEVIVEKSDSRFP